MPRYDQDFIALDTETGGLPAQLKKEATIDVALTEVAIVVIDNESLTIKKKDSWLIKPYAEGLIYQKEAEIASGISKSMCEKEGIEIEKVYLNLKAVFEKGKKGRNKPILIFHNKSFDTPFIENLFKIFNDDLWKYIDRIEDTMEIARVKWIEKPKFTLGAVAEYFGLDHVQAHRALPDTVITAEIFIKFLRLLRSEEGNQEENNNNSVKKNKFRISFKF